MVFYNYFYSIPILLNIPPHCPLEFWHIYLLKDNELKIYNYVYKFNNTQLNSLVQLIYINSLYCVEFIFAQIFNMVFWTVFIISLMGFFFF